MLADHEAGQLDGWVFGCDICQDVCPWNRKAPSGRIAELDARPEWTDPDLIEWLTTTPTDGEPGSRGRPWRGPNAPGCCATPRWCSGPAVRSEAVGPLAARLDDRGEDPVVRAAAAWALGRIGTDRRADRPRAASATTRIRWSGMRHARPGTARERPAKTSDRRATDLSLGPADAMRSVG